MKNFKYIFFCLSVAASTAMSTYALDASLVQTPLENMPATTAYSAVVADVNLTDVVFVKKDTAYDGSFSLQGKMGTQNDIVYGIVLYDEKRNVVDAQKIGEEKSLYEGEIKKYNFHYLLPKMLAADSVQVVLRVETMDGLVLGEKDLGKASVLVSSSTITCDTIVKGATSCTLSHEGDVLLSYSKSVFGEQGETKNIFVKKESSFDVTSPLSGRSYAFIRSGDNKKIVSLYPRGSYVSLVNAVVTKDIKTSNSLNVTIAVLSSGIKDLTVKAEVFNGQEACGKGETVLHGVAAKLLIPSSCTEGDVRVTVMSLDKIVATKTYPYKVISSGGDEKNQENQDQKSATSFGRLYGAIALCMAVIVIVYFNYSNRKKISSLVCLLFLLSSFASAQRANASTWFLMVMNAGESSHTVSGAVSTDKSSYSPGDSVVFTSTLNLEAQDMPAQTVDSSLGYSSTIDTYLGMTGGAPGVVMSPSGMHMDPYTTYNTSGSASVTIPAGTTAGSHFIGLRSLLYTHNGATRVDYTVDPSVDVSFTVAPATPKVRIYFSKLMHEMKNTFVSDVFAKSKQ